MLAILFCVFVLCLCIGIWIYVVNDLIKDFKKMSQSFKEKQRKQQRRRRW